MALHKPTRPGRTAARTFLRRGTSDVLVRRISALLGGVLICAAFLWFGWLVLRQHNPGLATIRFPFPGLQTQPTSQATVDPLAAAGVTLSTPAQGQASLLNEQQALLLAGQMEPQAAAQAGNVSAKYILFSYKGSSSTTPRMNNVLAWLVEYNNVAEAAPDKASDPHASSTTHDCYLFLDANSGQELLALWT